MVVSMLLGRGEISDEEWGGTNKVGRNALKEEGKGEM